MESLNRFIEAQEAVYPAVVQELAAGQKRTHWMWFIFPQVEGLGQSLMSKKFAIASRAEASAYASHPVLGARLRECTELVVAVAERRIGEILPYPDDLKFHACMTLFAVSSPSEIFRTALFKYYDGERHQATLDLLAGGP